MVELCVVEDEESEREDGEQKKVGGEPGCIYTRVERRKDEKDELSI